MAIRRRRREPPRHVTDWAGRYRLDGGDGWRDCRLLDVSGSRVTIEPLGLAPKERLVGTVLLELASMSGAEPVQFRGEIQHCTRMPTGEIHVGIEFVALSALAEQLLDLLFALRALV
ncbi:MAG: PilZ domain-containing protein [Acidimicrobiales bacterium]